MRSRRVGPGELVFRRDVERHALEVGQAINGLANLVRSGLGSPEGVVMAPVGTLYLQLDGGANTTLWIKESGTSDTGWAAK